MYLSTNTTLPLEMNLQKIIYVFTILLHDVTKCIRTMLRFYYLFPKKNTFPIKMLLHFAA